MSVVGALVLAAGVAAGPTTTPAEPAKSPMSGLTLNLWTCEVHEQFRMPAAGECPLCKKPLVRRKTAWTEPYPLDACPVSGKKLGSMGDPVVMTQEGREVRLCCPGCIKRFEDNAAEYWKQIDERIIAQQLDDYPMTTCPVSGEVLGSMGDPVNLVYDNRLVRFCCNGCVRGFKKDPTPVLAALDAAVITQQSADYPLKSCPVSHETLGSMGEPVDIVVANRLLRLCCGGCVAAVYADPASYLTQLANARSGG